MTLWSFCRGYTGGRPMVPSTSHSFSSGSLKICASDMCLWPPTFIQRSLKRPITTIEEAFIVVIKASTVHWLSASNKCCTGIKNLPFTCNNGMPFFMENWTLITFLVLIYEGLADFLYYDWGTLKVALHQIKWLLGQSSRCTVKCIRSKCNEGCDWCIYVTVVTCADTLTFTLCIQ